MSEQRDERIAALRDTITFAGEAIRIGDTAYDGIIEDITYDEIEVAGGRAESGGYLVVILKEDLPTMPEQFTPIEVRDNSLQILSAVDRNGVSWALTAADPVSTDE
jgi:hypothetical protein